MICEFCGSNTEKRNVRKQHWLHGKLYLVENVEAEVCCDCGERYFYAQVLNMIDEMLQSKHKVEKRLQVEVVRV